MTHERAKGWKIRRTRNVNLSDSGELTQQDQWMSFELIPTGSSFDTNILWHDDPIDGFMFTKRELAYSTRDLVRDRNQDPMVIYHAVVEA